MRRGLQENLVVALLLVGGFLWGVGWLVGVVLLWLSDAWTARQKVLGTLVVPGGFGAPLYAAIRIGLAGGPLRGLGLGAMLVLAAAALGSTVHLARSAAPRELARGARSV